MALFRPLFERAMAWSAHPRAPAFLAGLSFFEAFIFPVMPEVMLAPMTLAKPRNWARLATLSLGFSLLGSLVGYFLGHYAFEALKPALESIGWLDSIEQGVATLQAEMNANWMTLILVLALAALQPVVPMKFVTWASGIVGVPLLAFLACMVIGRGKRVYLLCGAIRLGGERAEQLLHRYIEWVGWVCVALLVALGLWWWLVHG